MKTIKNLIIILCCLFLSFTAKSQRPVDLHLRQYVFPASAMFFSGMLDGTIETISYHYNDGFKPVFPGANDQYWNPELSWSNKYKNGDPSQGPKFYGSTGPFVCFTDAYHGLRTLRNAVDIGTLTFYVDRVHCSNTHVKFKKMVLDALVLLAIRDIGFYTTYSLIFKTTGNY